MSPHVSRSGSIRNKLIAGILAGVLLPLGIGLAFIAVKEVRALERDMLIENTLVAAMVAEYTAAALAFEDRANASSSLAALSKRGDVIFAVLYDARGRPFASFAEPGTPVPQQLPPDGALHIGRGEGYIDVFEPVTRGESRLGMLHLRASTVALSNRIRAYLWGVAGIALGLGLFALAFAIALQRVVSRPILQLSEAARRITEMNDTSVRVRKLSEDEIGQLFDAFNTMVAEIARRQSELSESEQALKLSYGELRRTQEELVEKERLAAVGELAAVMAHEVRNPLGAMFNVLHAIERVWTPPPEAREMLRIVEEEADRLDRIVEDLLDFARPNLPERRPAQLDRVISSAVEVATGAAPSAELDIKTFVDPRLPPVPIDERMIRQALINLLINAVQAMPAGGHISVHATPELRDGTRFVRMEVTDNGPGMSPETTARLFQPFFTTKALGTGLGLAVVRRFVEAHRGMVSVKTAKGDGSTFTLYLPLQVAPDSQAVS
jgi:signal transduction histidine kinase